MLLMIKIFQIYLIKKYISLKNIEIYKSEVYCLILHVS